MREKGGGAAAHKNPSFRERRPDAIFHSVPLATIQC